MAKIRTQPALRRFGLYGLILLALALVSGVIFVLVTEEPALREADIFPEPVILDPEKRPDFIFPESVRTYDLSLNQFVDRFARVCMQGKYSDFRLMLSTRRPPILPPRFESNFNALKQVRILALEKLPQVPGVAGPIFVMKAEYELQEHAVRRGERSRQIYLAITQEDGAWRLGPIPHEALARWHAFKHAQSQPADEAEIVGEAPAASQSIAPPSPPPASKATANRPIRIES